MSCAGNNDDDRPRGGGGGKKGKKKGGGGGGGFEDEDRDNKGNIVHMSRQELFSGVGGAAESEWHKGQSYSASNNVQSAADDFALKLLGKKKK